MITMPAKIGNVDLKTLRKLEDLYLAIPPSQQDFVMGFLKGMAEAFKIKQSERTG